MSANIASIGAVSNWMNASAYNVANVNTKDFTPVDTAIVDKTAQNPAATYRNSGSKGTDLATEMTDQIDIEKSVGLNVAAINTKNEMVGTILDMKA